MTAPKEQLQVLISEIDGVLQKTTPRLPWVMSGDANQQRKVLERVRNHLVALQKRMTAEASDRPQKSQAEKSPADLVAYDIYYQPSLYQPPGQPQLPPGQPPDLAAPQMVYLLRQEMVQLRTTMIQPLQAELSTLRQQRETLQAEMRQLEVQIEMQRQNYLLQQQASLQHTLNDVLQAWMGRFQDSLAQQMRQSLQGIAPLDLSPQASLTLEATSGGQPVTVNAAARSPLPWSVDGSIANLSVPLPADPVEVITQAAVAADRSPSAGFPYPGSEMPAIAQSTPVLMDAAIDSWIRDTGADGAVSAAPLPAFTDLNLAELSLSQLAAQEIDQEIDPEINQELDGLRSPEILPLTVPLAAVPDASSQLPSQPPSEMSDDLDDFYHSLFGSAGTEPLAPAVQGSEAQSSAAAIARPQAPVSDRVDQINSLTDLFADMPPLSATSSSAEPVKTANIRFDAHEGDDPFILASPEETLLPGALAELESEADVELDEITLSSLSEDLFNLERQPVAAAPDPDSGRLTLEDMGSLFRDVLPAPPTPPSALPAPGDTFDLFAASSSGTPGSSVDQAAPPEALFTFDDISALFADADALSVGQVPASPSPATADSASASVVSEDFTLGDFTPEDLTPMAFTPRDFTLERLDDLFVEVPALDPATSGQQSTPSKSAPLDFTLDQIGNLFMEVPAASPTQAGASTRRWGDRSESADPADSGL